MTSDQHIETALQRHRIQPPLEAQGTGDMVGGAVRGQLPKEPLTLLGVGQWQRLITTDRHQCRRLLTEAPFHGVQGAGKTFQAWLLEHQLERYFAPQRMPQARNHLHGQQRMPAHFKEVIGQPYAFDTQDLRPYGGDLLLQFSHRCHPCLLRLTGVGFGQRVTVQLAIWVQRHAVKEDEVGRNHIIRQLFAQRQFEGCSVLLFGNQIGDQLIVDGQHQCFAHAGLGQQQRLDFTQLDTKTTNLDLMIDPPDILNDPIGAIACQVAGAVQALAGCAERVRHKALSREQCAVQIGARQTAAATDVQLAHRPQRRQVQVAVQHIKGATWQGTANRAGGGTDDFSSRCAIQHTRHHGCFCRAISIEQAHMAKTGFHPLCWAVQWHGFATDVHLSKRAIRPWPRRQAVEQEQVPVSGRQVSQGDALGDDFVVQPSAVPQLRPAQDHRRAVGQCRVELFDETVEIQGSELQYAVILGQARIVGGHPRKLGQRRMIDGHAFGLAGGTGGVYHVGQVVFVDLDLRVALAVVGQPRLRHVQRHHALGQRHRHMGLRQHQTHTAVLKHVQQAFTWVLRVQRHIGAASLEHGQQTDHHLERALDRYTHPHFRADTARDQRMRQAIGLVIQLGITDCVLAQAQGNRLRAALHLSLEQPVNACRRFERRATLVPGIQQITLFRIDQHCQLRHTGVRTPGYRAQQTLPMLGHALHSGRVKQVSGVGQRSPDTLRGFLSIQAKVELCALTAPLQRLKCQARQLQLATRLMRFSLVVEHHLKQWVVAQAAFRLQRLDQLLERQILMALRLECALLDLGQQLTEEHLPVDIGLEHLGIDEEADKALGFCAITVGDRYTDADIRLPAVAIQQRLK